MSLSAAGCVGVGTERFPRSDFFGIRKSEIELAFVIVIIKLSGTLF